MAYWTPLMAGIPWVLQTINNGTVDVVGDAAMCRWFHTDFAVLADGTKRMAIGLYYDTALEETDGGASRIGATSGWRRFRSARMYKRSALPVEQGGMWQWSYRGSMI